VDPPRLLVYLPIAYETAQMPLAELLTFGETLRPGEKGLANTRLAVIARRALKSLLPEAKLAGLDREIDDNKLSLTELEDLAIGGAVPGLPTVLSVIYGTQQAGEMLCLGREIEAELKSPAPAAALAAAYTRRERPWSRLDTLHRRFEKKASSLEVAFTEQPDEIERLIAATRQRYTQAADRMAEAFVRALAAASFDLPGWYRQAQSFERAVAPELGAKRVAYLMVDALRYELACELAELLAPEFEVEIEALSGAMPGITAVGMAALLPHAASGLTLRCGKKDGIEVAIGDAVLRGRDDRIAFLEKHAGVPVVPLKLEDPKQFKSRLKKLGDAPAPPRRRGSPGS